MPLAHTSGMAGVSHCCSADGGLQALQSHERQSCLPSAGPSMPCPAQRSTPCPAPRRCPPAAKWSRQGQHWLEPARPLPQAARHSRCRQAAARTPCRGRQQVVPFPRQLACVGYSPTCCTSMQLQTVMAALQAHSMVPCPQQGWLLQRQPLPSWTMQCHRQPLSQRAVELLLHQRHRVPCSRAARRWAVKLGSRSASAGQRRSWLGSSSVGLPQIQLQAFVSNTYWQDQMALTQPWEGMRSSGSSLLLRSRGSTPRRGHLSHTWRQPCLGTATLRSGSTLLRGAATQAQRQLLLSRATACRGSTLCRVEASQARQLLSAGELEWPGTPSQASGWPTSTLGANRSVRLLLATTWSALTCHLSWQVDSTIRAALHIKRLHGCTR